MSIFNRIRAAVSRTMEQLVLLFRRSELVVTTHTPGGWCKPGTVYQWREGHPWHVLTDVRRVAPTLLIGGGRAPCFEIWGKRIKPAPMGGRAKRVRPSWS